MRAAQLKHGLPSRAFPCGSAGASADDFQRPVIVAMTVMRMVQTAVHQIADMVSMRDGLMSASGAMDMTVLMTEILICDGRTLIRVLVGYFDDMLVHMIFMRMVKMTVVKIVHVIAVAHRRMAATGSVNMRMVFMFRIRAGHLFLP